MNFGYLSTLRVFPSSSTYKHGANLGTKGTQAMLVSNILCVVAMIPKGYKFSPWMKNIWNLLCKYLVETPALGSTNASAQILVSYLRRDPPSTAASYSDSE